MSTQVSDETNIIRLINLAQQQRLAGFDIQLPYALDAEQLTAIRNECEEGVTVALVGERMSISIRRGN